MRKGVMLLTILLVSLFFISFASAGWFSNGWSFITGHAISPNEGLVFSSSEEIYLGGKSYNDVSIEGLPYGSSAKSLCAFASTDSLSSGWNWIFSFGSPSPTGAFFIGRNGADLFGGGFADDVKMASFWTINKTNHICLTYDGVTAKLYANGNLVNSTKKSWNVIKKDARIGSQVGFSPFNQEMWEGVVSDIRVYNRVLSEVEVKELYSPTLICSSITYSAWSVCSNGQQTRTITSSSPSGCIKESQEALSQNCTVFTPTCVDSDGGFNPYILGETKQQEKIGGTIISWIDVCWTESAGEVESCSGSDCSIFEGNCSGLSVVPELFACPFKCLNGACVNLTEPLVKNPEFGTCYSNDDCISDLCNPETNECASIPCGSDADCASGFVCDQSLSNCVPSSNIPVQAVVQSSCPNLVASNGFLFNEIGGYVLEESNRTFFSDVGVLDNSVVSASNSSVSSSYYYIYTGENKNNNESLLILDYLYLSSEENISSLPYFQNFLARTVWNLENVGGNYYYNFLTSGETSLVSYLSYPNGQNLITVSLYSNNPLVDKRISQEAIQKYMISCSSEIQSSCNPQWSKIYESVVCPTSGINTVLWHDENGCEADFTKDVDCTPNVCTGCEADNTCYPVGYRVSAGYYCDLGNMQEQKTEGEICNNNFECSTNVCINGSCISMGLWEKFLSWFQSIFGTGLTKTLEVSL